MSLSEVTKRTGKISTTWNEETYKKYEQVLKIYYNQDILYFDRLYARISRYGNKLIPLKKWPSHLKEKYRFIEMVVNTTGQPGPSQVVTS